MNFSKQMMMLGTAMLLAPAAVAQDAPAPAATPAAPAPTAATVTDTEATQFATAVIAIQKLRADTSVPEAGKNERFVEIINGSGLAPDRYNAIAAAMQSDPALTKRIQDAAAALPSAPAPAAAPAPAPAPGATPAPTATPTPRP